MDTRSIFTALKISLPGLPQYSQCLRWVLGKFAHTLHLMPVLIFRLVEFTVFTFPTYAYKAYGDMVLVTVPLITPAQISPNTKQNMVIPMSNESTNSCSGLQGGVWGGII
jgi:hypothetical protein